MEDKWFFITMMVVMVAMMAGGALEDYNESAETRVAIEKGYVQCEEDGNLLWKKECN